MSGESPAPQLDAGLRARRPELFPYLRVSIELLGLCGVLVCTLPFAVPSVCYGPHTQRLGFVPGKGCLSWADWLGTSFLPFEEARKWRGSWGSRQSSAAHPGGVGCCGVRTPCSGGGWRGRGLHQEALPRVTQRRVELGVRVAGQAERVAVQVALAREV